MDTSQYHLLWGGGGGGCKRMDGDTRNKYVTID